MKHRILSLLLALSLLLTLLPMGVFAEAIPADNDSNFAAYRTKSGDTWDTWQTARNGAELKSAIHDKENLTVEIYMSRDWNLKTDWTRTVLWNTYGDRISIGAGSNITIHMRGHEISRGLTGSESYGNVFCLESSASLTLIGNEEGQTNLPTHTVQNYYTGSGTETISGGTVSGSFSSDTDCGAIYMKENSTLTLDHVTVAGNKSSSGNGGAIHVNATGCTINMENSRICYNYAAQRGGGLRFDSGNINTYTATMNMTASSIDHNYAGYNGGGIQCDGVLTLTGDGVSSISYNECVGYRNDSNNNTGGGGGINCYYGGSVFKDIIIEHNKTNNYQGGGISCEGTKGTIISGCTIQYNTATGSTYGQGGGVFIKHSTSSLADCEIHYNDATVGDGVYLRNGATALGGLLNITDNGTQSGDTWTGTNLYIASGAYITPSLNNTSTIGVTVADASTSRKLTESAGTYSPYCYTYDNNADYGFKWYNEDPTAGDNIYRHLYLVSAANADKAPTPVTTINGATLLPDTVKDYGTYTAADNNTYPMIKTWFSNPSANDSVNDIDAICFYTDGYFFDDPDDYNEHLATMSHALTMAGFTAHLGNKGADLYDLSAYPETLGTRYDVKHIHVRQLLANIGCPEENFYANDYSYIKPQTDSIGVAMSSKELPDGSYLIPVVVRGSDYESEWASNFTLNGSGEAGGFSDAATKTRQHIEAYLEKYDLGDDALAGNVKFWVVGYSRAGATANITAKRLIEDYGNSTVFCYTFEAAQGGIDAAETENAEAYYCIHNIINAADAVPMVAPTEMGFKRYGVDHYVPGTAAGTVSVHTSDVTRGEAASIRVTTYTDNEPLNVGTTNYSTLRSAMLAQYRVFNPYMVFDDYYSRAEINWATSQLPVFSKPFNEPVSSTQKVEDYLTELMATLQSWKIENRAWFYENYVLQGGDGDTKTTTYNKSFQGALRDVFRMLYGKTPAETDQIIEDVKSVMNGVGVFGSYVNAADLLDLYNNVIQGWHTKGHDYKVEKLTWVWGILQKTGVFDNFTSEEIADLEQDWPILGDTILTFLSKDFQDGDRQVMGTLLYNYQRILLNHYSETVMAWLRASDSYYGSETSFYQIQRPATLAAPKAAAVATGSDDFTLTPEAPAATRCGDQTLHLDVDTTVGEAIYYTVNDGTTTTDETVYGNGIALAAPAANETPIIYTVGAYAISYGKVVTPVTYTVIVYDGHQYNVSYTWADDCSTCTANAVCDHCGNTVTETVSSTSTDTTVGKAPYKRYTATFTNALFSTQTQDVAQFATVVGYNLTPNGDIRVNAHISVPAPFLAENPNLNITLNGGTPIYLNGITETEDENGFVRTGNVFKLPYTVPAKNIQDTVMLRLYNNNDEVKIQHDSELKTEIEYSVQTYLTKVIEDAGVGDQLTSEQNAALVDLCKAMTAYGSYAQVQQDYVNGSAKYPDAPNPVDLTQYDGLTDAIDAITISKLTYQTSLSYPTTNNLTGVSFYGTSLIMVSEMTLRVYFTIEDANGLSAKVNGVDAELHAYGNGTKYYYVDVKNIAAKDFDKEQTVTITDGTNSFTVGGNSVHRYIWKSLTNPKNENRPEVQNLVKSIAYYGFKAADYFTLMNHSQNNE